METHSPKSAQNSRFYVLMQTLSQKLKFQRPYFYIITVSISCLTEIISLNFSAI